MNYMLKNGTIEMIIKSELCTGCGTCVGTCPKDAIEIVKSQNGIYVPQINHEKCNKCGICLTVCPGYPVNFKMLNLEIFGKEPKDSLIGNHISCYTGYATDHQTRYTSASGGVITALLLFALDEGIIDGALVTKMSEKNPLEPEVYLARRTKDIISASRSKYCPVSLNIALRELLNERGKFAIVGLPCHIHGVRKAEMINKKLKKKIVLHLGIFCSHTVNFLGTEFLLSKLGIKKEDVEKINYRGEGWPGMMTLSLKRGKKVSVPALSGLFGLVHQAYFFTPTRCITCLDQTCELADISFGDAWLPEFADEKTGISIIMSRTKLGEEILRDAVSKGWIILNKTTRNKVVFSQRSALCFKKTSKEKLLGTRLLHRSIPNYNVNLLKPSVLSNFFSALVCFSILVSENKILRNLLKYVPLKILGLYLMLISILENKSARVFWNTIHT